MPSLIGNKVNQCPTNGDLGTLAFQDSNAVNITGGNLSGTTFSAGTVSAPAITTTGDTNTGIFFPAADTIAFAEGGVEAMRIDSSGQLLIGATSGTNVLTVVGASTMYHKFSGGAGAFQFGQFNTSGDVSLNNQANANMLFATNNTERMRITSTGLVGIGTSSPNTNLEISTSIDPILRLNNSTNTVTTGADIGEIQFYTNDASTNGTGVKGFIKTVAQAFGSAQGGADLVFGTAAFAVGDASEKMRLDKDGNLGLGVTPSAWWSSTKALQIGGSSSLNDFSSSGNRQTTLANNAFLNSTPAWTYINTDAATRYHQTGGQHQWFTAPSGTAGNAITFTQAMTLDASGNLGIGTTAQVAKLQATRNGAPATSGNLVASMLASAGDGSQGLAFGATTSDYTWIQSAFTNNAGVSAGSLRFYMGATERMRIDSSGALFIAATAQSSDSLNANGFRFGAGSFKQQFSTGFDFQQYYISAGQAAPDASVTIPAANSYSIKTNSTERMRIDSSGNVGIGTTSPNAKITIAQGSENYAVNIQGNSSSQAGVVRFTDAAFTVEQAIISSVNGGGLLFRTGSGSTERMRITSGGSLCVGTTTSVNSGLVTVNGWVNANRYFSGPNGAGSWNHGAEATTGTPSFIVYNSNGTGVFIAFGATAWSANSDERLKENLQPITNAINKVNSLRSVTGKYKTDAEGTSRAFLIAQDVQAVLPEAVSENSNGYLGLAYTETIPLLVAAIKEQQAIINDLQTRITQLENK